MQLNVIIPTVQNQQRTKLQKGTSEVTVKPALKVGKKHQQSSISACRDTKTPLENERSSVKKNNNYGSLLLAQLISFCGMIFNYFSCQEENAYHMFEQVIPNIHSISFHSL